MQFFKKHKLQVVFCGKVYEKIVQNDKSKTFVTQVQSVGVDYNKTLHVKKDRTYLYIDN